MCKINEVCTLLRVYLLFVKTDKPTKWSIRSHFCSKYCNENRIMSERNWVESLYLRPDGLRKLPWAEIYLSWAVDSNTEPTVPRAVNGVSQAKLEDRPDAGPNLMCWRNRRAVGLAVGGGRMSEVAQDEVSEGLHPARFHQEPRTVFNKGVTWSDLHLRNISGCYLEEVKERPVSKTGEYFNTWGKRWTEVERDKRSQACV